MSDTTVFILTSANLYNSSSAVKSQAGKAAPDCGVEAATGCCGAAPTRT